MLENDVLEELMLEMEEKMDKTIDVYKTNLLQIRAGRANPHVLDKVLVEAYGVPTPINQIGNISVLDAQCLVISPWDKSLAKQVEKAILAANIGLTPTNDGTVIRLIFPMLTEERRKDLVKQIKKMGEDSKVAIRNIRRDYLDTLKKHKTNKEITEDVFDDFADDIEKTTTKKIEVVEKITSDKEKDLMTL